MAGDPHPHDHQWQIHEVEQHFAQVLDIATTDGPQIIVQDGRPAAILISCEEYLRFIQQRSTASFRGNRDSQKGGSVC